MTIQTNIVNPTKNSEIAGAIIKSSIGILQHGESCIINKNSLLSDSDFVAGLVVKVVGYAEGGKLIVDKATSTTDALFGFISTEVKGDSLLKKGSLVQIIKGMCTMTAVASEAIPVGSKVEIVPAGNKVAVQDTGTLFGVARSSALADGDFIAIELGYSLDIK